MKFLNTILLALLCTQLAFGADFVTGVDKLKTGKSSSGADKIIEFDIGAGTANPKMKYSIGDTALEFANDGTSFSQFGSGGGGGGLNLLTGNDNAGFEQGTTGWTASGGTFTTTSSSPYYGTKMAQWTASASSQTLMSNLKAIPVGLQNGNCLLAFTYSYSGATGDYSAQVYDGTNIIASLSLPQATSPSSTTLNFTCPASGSIRARFISNVASPGLLSLDGYAPAGGFVQLGSALNAGQVAQAQYVGSAYWPTTASCTWQSSSGTWSSFSANASCVNPTVTGSVQAPATKIPGVTVNVVPGVYKIVVQGLLGQYSSSTASFRLTDGTNTSGFARSGSENYNDLIGAFTETTSGTLTFQIQTKLESGAGGGQVTVASESQQLYISVYRYPTQSQTVTTTDAQAMSWSGHITGCNWTTTSTTFADPTMAGSCTFTQDANQNFGSVTQAASSGPGFVWTPKVTGQYLICANSALSVSGGASGNQAAFQLLDGSGAVLGTAFNNNGPTLTTSSVCGVSVVTSAGSAQTVKLKLATQTLTGQLGINGASIAGVHSIDFSIFNISQTLPSPVVQNQVSTSTLGGERIERVQVLTRCSGSPCAITKSSPGIASVTRTGTGIYQINFVTAYSDTPSCVMAVDNPGISPATVGITGGTKTANSYGFTILNSTNGAAVDGMFDAICTGPR